MSQVAVKKADATELAMRIRTSTWGRRLWTLHEARLAKTCYYQFSDRAVTYSFLEECAKKEYSPFSDDFKGSKPAEYLDWLPRSRLSSINRILESSLRWMSSQEQGVASGGDERDAHWRLSALTQSLTYRWTSRLEDETICLAGILHQNPSKVLQYDSAEDRKCAFLTSFESLPADILFVQRPRSRRKGYRWAPLSFLGGSLRNAGSYMPEHVKVCVEGLRLSSLPTLLLHGSKLLEEASDVFAIHHEGNCYSVRLLYEGKARQFASARLAILLPYSLDYYDDPPPGALSGQATGALLSFQDRKTKENRLLFEAQYEVPVQLQRKGLQCSISPSRCLTTTVCSKRHQWLIN